MIKRIFTIFLDRSFFLFLLIGLANTFISLALMFILYNKFNLGYWGSSSIAFIITSILSYILNKRFSFKSHGSVVKTAAKFSIVIAVCYCIAYLLAKPAVFLLLKVTSLTNLAHYSEQIAMFIGQCIFTLLNYLGQRFFAFNVKPAKH